MKERTVGRDGFARLVCGDAVDVMRHLEAVDHVIADPPYEEEAHGAGRRVLASSRQIIAEPLDFAPMTSELRRAASAQMVRVSNGWVLAFCQVEAISLWRTDFVEAGGSWRRAMIWVKPDGAPQLSGDRPAQGCEGIACAWAGDGRSVWNGGGRSGVLTFNKHDSGQGHGGRRNPHPTTKPNRLMRAIVELFTQPGDTVLDPFMGSGSTGVACLQLGRRFMGIEQRPDYFELAARRIGHAHEQLELAL